MSFARNHIYYINHDQLDKYQVENISSNDFVVVGVFSVDLDGTDTLTSIDKVTTDISGDFEIQVDLPNKKAVVLFRKASIDDDINVSLFINATIGTESGTQILKTENKIVVLSGYITCPNDSRTEIWALDFESTKMQSDAINEDVITQNIMDIVMTPYGARVRRPNYGTSVPTSIFSKMTSFLGEDLLDEVIQQVTLWETKVLVDSDRAGLEIFPSKNTIIITLPYFIKENEKRVLFRKMIEGS